MLLLLSTLLLAAPGDRLFARAATLLFSNPSETSRPVRGLLPGDELVWLEQTNDDLVNQKPPVGWLPVQTVDVPSERSFAGWVPSRAVSADPLAPEKRTAVLHQAIDEALTELAARQKPFADLRGQVLAWRDKAAANTGDSARAGAEVQRLANQLARYMEAEVTPRALDIQDALSELKELNDPAYPVRASRFEKLAHGFQP